VVADCGRWDLVESWRKSRDTRRRVFSTLQYPDVAFPSSGYFGGDNCDNATVARFVKAREDIASYNETTPEELDAEIKVATRIAKAMDCDNPGRHAQKPRRQNRGEDEEEVYGGNRAHRRQAES